MAKQPMKVAIIGVGFVGGALQNWFYENTDHELRLYDPGKGFFHKISDCDATFICIPVPTDINKQDYTILENVLPMAAGITFIRSTVLPGTNDKYKTYSCPEFLSERTANEDIDRMGIMTGYDNMEFMERLFPNKEILQMKNSECELAKYSHNAFGAIKVNFFNNIYSICSDLKIDYKTVLAGVLMSGYINETHTSVPGHDGMFGYGGTCLPKDLKAFQGAFPHLSFDACLFENIRHRAKPLLAAKKRPGKPKTNTVEVAL